MIIKQYAVTLPADYDMKIIRDRVAKKGPAFDHFPGLGIKVYMIREKGRFGSESNQYAPVYLWPSVAPMWEFIAGDGFKGILESFGWTPINNWLGLAYARRSGLRWTDLRSVSREEASISPGTNLAALRAQEIAAARKAVEQDAGPVASAIGVDTNAWSLVRFHYWTVAQDALSRGARSYEVLHVSAAAPDALTET